MQAKPNITHLYRSDGGIFYYSQVIDQVYAAQGFTVNKVVVKDESKINPDRLPGNENTIYHIELGVDDVSLFQLSRKLVKSNNKVIITIHDPGTIIYNFSGISIPHDANQIVTTGLRAARKILNLLLRAYILPRWNKLDITRLYLNKKDAHNGYYLPHPTYLKDLKKRKDNKKSDSAVIGFTGYWGPWKGIDELISACVQIAGDTALKLIVAGETSDPKDPYRVHVHGLAEHHSFISLPGFVMEADYTMFLEGLDVLVIPYYLEIPGGISATAQRSLELGLPMVASKTPALMSQIGEGNAIFVEPKSVDSLRDGILEYLSNRETYDVRARSRQQEIYEHNGWPAVGHQLASIVGEVASK